MSMSTPASFKSDAKWFLFFFVCFFFTLWRNVGRETINLIGPSSRMLSSTMMNDGSNERRWWSTHVFYLQKRKEEKERTTSSFTEFRKKNKQTTKVTPTRRRRFLRSWSGTVFTEFLPSFYRVLPGFYRVVHGNVHRKEIGTGRVIIGGLFYRSAIDWSTNKKKRKKEKKRKDFLRASNSFSFSASRAFH